MELYEPVEVLDVTIAVNTASPMPNLTSLPSMFAPTMFRPASCGGGAVSAQSQTTKPTTKSATMTISNTQPDAWAVRHAAERDHERRGQHGDGKHSNKVR